jgi:putative transposase
MNKHQPLGNDILAEPAETQVRHPCLDDLLADNLVHGDLVVIDGLLHQFQYKEKDAGPHIFFDTHNQKSAPFYTAELINLMNEGSYIRPGGGKISADDLKNLDEAGRERLRLLLGSVRTKPRKKAQIRWLYVARFLNKISEAQAQGELFARVESNAIIVTEEVDKMLLEANAAQSDPGKHLVRPKCVQPRTVLTWVANELSDGLAEMGVVHGNALKPRDRVLPQFVFDTIALQMRTLFKQSGKITPEQLFRAVRGQLKHLNDTTGTSYPLPGKNTVWKEFKRYDPWYRIAKDKGPKAADLEYGAIGKLVEPTFILELVEMDAHKFDFHGIVGKTSWGKRLSNSGIDRFWILLMLDVHSRYPLGFQLSFEQDSLLTALSCVDHAIRMKDYVAKRWPHINGALLGFGKPIRLRYDNAKVYIGLQIEAALARVGISFQNSKAKIPNSKPYVEAHFGTLERDFVQWLSGATGSKPSDKGERKPVEEAKLSMEDFAMLLHQYYIECYARRPQEDLGWRTPEQVWLAGLSSSKTRPRSLTKAESDRMDIIASIVEEFTITREGIQWKGIFYQSHELQDIRLRYGNARKGRGNVKVQGRIPLKNVGKIYVTDPVVDHDSDEPIEELEVVSAHPHVHGRTHWQHMVIRDELLSTGRDPENWADYEAGLRRLFLGAMTAMGVKVPGADPKAKPRLTGGQAGRFTGIFMAGSEHHALHNLERDVQRYDLFGEIAEQVRAKSKTDAVADVTRPTEELRPATTFRADPLEIDGDDALTTPAPSGHSVVIDTVADGDELDD